MIKIIAGALMIAALPFSAAMAQAPAVFAVAEKQYDALCEGCHGEGAGGGDRAPALVNNPTLRSMTEVQIRDVISNGTPGGMPSFKLPDSELRAMAGWLRSLNMSAFDTKSAGNVQAGADFFFGKGQCF